MTPRVQSPAHHPPPNKGRHPKCSSFDACFLEAQSDGHITGLRFLQLTKVLWEGARVVNVVQGWAYGLLSGEPWLPAPEQVQRQVTLGSGSPPAIPNSLRFRGFELIQPCQFLCLSGSSVPCALHLSALIQFSLEAPSQIQSELSFINLLGTSQFRLP